jgi:hypothetical protein
MYTHLKQKQNNMKNKMSITNYTIEVIAELEKLRNDTFYTNLEANIADYYYSEDDYTPYEIAQSIYEMSIY